MYRNFIFNEAHRVVFAYVPKVACTNWKAVMRRLNGAEDWLDNVKAHDETLSELTFLDPRKHKDILADTSVRKYAIVRNPYTRALSGYMNKVAENLPPQTETAPFSHWDKVVADIESFRKQHLNTSEYPEITFQVFLLWLEQSGSWYTKDEHWAPQHVLLKQPEIEFDFIGRFENLSHDAAFILKDIGLEFEFPSQKQVKFKPKNADAHLKAHLTEAAACLIEKLYDQDFTAFGYKRQSTRSLSQVKEGTENPDLRRHKVNAFITTLRSFESERTIEDQFYKEPVQEFDRAPFADFVRTHTGFSSIVKQINEFNDTTSPIRVYDIGAYMGVFATMVGTAALEANIEFEAFCIEANKGLLEGLEENLGRYQIAANVMPVALAESEGTKTLAHKTGQMVAGQLRFDIAETPSDETFDKVPSITLGGLLPSSSSISIVKMSIRGLEPSCFRSIARNPKLLTNLFFLTFHKWQGQVDIDGSPYATWLFENFHVVELNRWQNWRRAELLTDRDQLIQISEDGEVQLMLIPIQTFAPQEFLASATEHVTSNKSA